MSNQNLSGLNLVAIEYNGAYHERLLSAKEKTIRTNELNSVSDRYFVNADIYRNSSHLKMFLSIKRTWEIAICTGLSGR